MPQLRNLTKDLSNPAWIKLKGALFLLMGLLSGTLLLIEQPSLRAALLLTVCIWCFCRFYYFAFYVIEHYIDPSYRFASLWSFVLYLVSKRNR